HIARAGYRNRGGNVHGRRELLRSVNQAESMQALVVVPSAFLGFCHDVKRLARRVNYGRSGDADFFVDIGSPRVCERHRRHTSAQKAFLPILTTWAGIGIECST